MKLTPLDIQQQQFRSVLWGFDPKEVDAFLDLVANGFEDLIRESNALRDELRRKDAQLEEHRDREKTLKETMITATRISEEIKQGSRKEAEIVISAAEVQAEQIIQNAHTRLVRIMEDINELKRQKAQFEGGLRATLMTHQKLLDALSSETGEDSPMLRRNLVSSGDTDIGRRGSTVEGNVAAFPVQHEAAAAKSGGRSGPAGPEDDEPRVRTQQGKKR